jgi:hypothetical protein
MSRLPPVCPECSQHLREAPGGRCQRLFLEHFCAPASHADAPFSSAPVAFSLDGSSALPRRPLAVRHAKHSRIQKSLAELPSAITEHSRESVAA